MTILSAFMDRDELSENDADTRSENLMSPEIAGLLSALLRFIDQRGSIVVYLDTMIDSEKTTTKVCDLKDGLK